MSWRKGSGSQHWCQPTESSRRLPLAKSRKDSIFLNWMTPSPPRSLSCLASRYSCIANSNGSTKSLNASMPASPGNALQRPATTLLTKDMAWSAGAMHHLAAASCSELRQPRRTALPKPSGDVARGDLGDPTGLQLRGLAAWRNFDCTVASWGAVSSRASFALATISCISRSRCCFSKSFRRFSCVTASTCNALILPLSISCKVSFLRPRPIVRFCTSASTALRLACKDRSSLLRRSSASL
mmetsp:Transcript_100250/g.289437  ORF Transcript_100250/g.289437 Transcript_100250/m.289437 type:complete len:241 (-) Transcript_100250:1401-2123(-)